MVPVGFYQSVVSFLNHEGGVILLGVDDDGLVRGQAGQKKGSSLNMPESTESTSYNSMIFKRGQAAAKTYTLNFKGVDYLFNACQN